MRVLDETLFEIRDVKDYPVFYTAILEDGRGIVDVLLMGEFEPKFPLEF